jgi:opacity protein-like surface antigen
MKRTVLVLALAAATGPLAHAEDVVPSNYQFGELDFGLSAVHEDTNSSKFTEYRDIPNGFVLPLFRLDGQKDGFRYELFGADARERDQRYRLGLEKGWLRFDGSYQFIPHDFGNGARSLENHTGGGIFVVSDALQTAHNKAIVGANNTSYAFVNSLVQPSLAAATPFDLKFDRQRANGLITLEPSAAVSVKVGYFNEQRRGYRGGIGTSFGFSNAVETPEDMFWRVATTVAIATRFPSIDGTVRYLIELPAGNYRVSMRVDCGDSCPDGAELALSAGGVELRRTPWPAPGSIVALVVPVTHPGGKMHFEVRVDGKNVHPSGNLAALWVSAFEVESERR